MSQKQEIKEIKDVIQWNIQPTVKASDLRSVMDVLAWQPNEVTMLFACVGAVFGYGHDTYPETMIPDILMKELGPTMNPDAFVRVQDILVGYAEPSVPNPNIDQLRGAVSKLILKLDTLPPSHRNAVFKQFDRDSTEDIMKTVAFTTNFYNLAWIKDFLILGRIK
jgi:hypothetical protein